MTEFTLFIVVVTASWLGNFISQYFNEKGKNLATKEDIEEITEKVEAVKNQLSAKHQKTIYYIEEQLRAYKDIDDVMYKYIGHFFSVPEENDTKHDMLVPLYCGDTDGSLPVDLIKVTEKNRLFVSEDLVQKTVELVEFCSVYSDTYSEADSKKKDDALNEQLNLIYTQMRSIRERIKTEILDED